MGEHFTDENARDALESMMREHGDSIVRLCALYLRDAALAQDAAQETFFKAFRHYHAFRHESSEKTWLSRIAVRTCRDMQRGAWFRLVDRRIRAEEVKSCADDDPFQGEVTQAVMGLPDHYRLPILLHYYQNVSVRDVAAMLHLPLNTALSRLKRGREMLKKELEKERGEGGIVL